MIKGNSQKGKRRSDFEWIKKFRKGWQEPNLDQLVAQPQKLSKSVETNIIKLIEDVKWAEIYDMEVPKDAYNIIGFYYFNKYEYSNSAHYFKKAIKADKKSYLPYYNYAAALAYLGQQNEDIKTLEESLLTINKAPKEGEYKEGHILYQKAWILDTMWRIKRGNKKFKQALEMYKRSIKLNEKEGNKVAADFSRYNIACMQALAEEFDEAQKSLLELKNSKEMVYSAKKDSDFETMRKMSKYKAIFE